MRRAATSRRRPGGAATGSRPRPPRRGRETPSGYSTRTNGRTGAPGCTEARTGWRKDRRRSYERRHRERADANASRTGRPATTASLGGQPRTAVRRGKRQRVRAARAASRHVRSGHAAAVPAHGQRTQPERQSNEARGSDSTCRRARWCESRIHEAAGRTVDAHE